MSGSERAVATSSGHAEAVRTTLSIAGRGLRTGFAAVKAARRRARERRRFRALAQDPRFLKDLGISYIDAMQEVEKSRWRP